MLAPLLTVAVQLVMCMVYRSLGLDRICKWRAGGYFPCQRKACCSRLQGLPPIARWPRRLHRAPGDNQCFGLGMGLLTLSYAWHWRLALSHCLSLPLSRSFFRCSLCWRAEGRFTLCLQKNLQNIPTSHAFNSLASYGLLHSVERFGRL